MVSEEFKTFKNQYHSKSEMNKDRKELDIKSLHLLDQKKKNEVEEILLEQLANNEEDENTIAGLRELKSKRAVPLLKARLPNPILDANIEEWPAGKANMVLEACLALWKIEGSFITMDWIIRILLRTPHQQDRMKAAYCLRYFPCKQAEDALMKFLNDENEFIRLHVVTSLLIMHGIWADEVSYPPLARQVASKIPKVRLPAIQIVQKIMENSPLPRLWMK